jgi:hypothetical protein
MGEAGLAARSASEIGMTSILALGIADARLLRASSVGAIIESLGFLHLFCNARAHDSVVRE